MDFKKTLKNRLYIAIIFIALGIAMIIGAFISKTDNTFISSFGLALAVVGGMRLRNYFFITKDELSIKKQQIIETDERNILIINKARSFTFLIYSMILCAAIIILSFLNQHEAAKWISFSLLLLAVIYLISYYVIKKKY